MGYKKWQEKQRLEWEEQEVQAQLDEKRTKDEQQLERAIVYGWKKRQKTKQPNKNSMNPAIDLLAHTLMWWRQSDTNGFNLHDMVGCLNRVAELALKAIRLEQLGIPGSEGGSSVEEAEMLVKDALKLRDMVKDRKSPILIQNKLEKLVETYAQSRW